MLRYTHSVTDCLERDGDKPYNISIKSLNRIKGLNYEYRNMCHRFLNLRSGAQSSREGAFHEDASRATTAPGPY